MNRERLRVGLIGVGGYSSGYHVPNLLRRDDVLIAAATDTADRRDKVLSATRAERFFTDHRAMIDAGAIDAVIVSTPHGLHFEHGMAALEAGLPTMIDKPLAIGAARAWGLVETARAHKVLLMTALNRHFDPGSRYAKRAIASGAAGDIQLTISVQRGFAAGAASTWLNHPEMGGGMLYGRTSHMADLLPWLHDSPVVEVEADVQYDDAGHHVSSIVRGSLASGQKVQMVSLAVSERYQDAVSVYGSKESVHLERATGGGGWVATRSRVDHPFEAVPAAELPAGSTSTDNFVDAVLGHGAPLATGEDGARAVRVIEAALESAAARRPVRV